MSNSLCTIIKEDYLELKKLINNIKKNSIVICTWGACGKMVYRWCEENDTNVKAIVDNDSNKWGNTVFNINIEPFNNIIFDENTYYIIATYNQYLFNDIYQQLINLKVDNSNIVHVSLFENILFSYPFNYKKYLNKYFNSIPILDNINRIEEVADMLSDTLSKDIYYRMIACHYNCYEFTIPEKYCGPENYFDWDFFKYSKEEVLVQCGVMDGATIESFIEIAPDYSKIIGIEADENNYNLALKRLEKYNNIELINKAIADQDNCDISFCSVNTGRSHIEFLGDVALTNIRDNEAMGETGKANCIVKSIKGDSIKATPTFIQMDIEGAEMSALNGFKDMT